MRFKIQVLIEEDDEQTLVEEIISLDKGLTDIDCIGLSLAESKQILKKLQQVMVQSQAFKFIESNRHCQCCSKQRGLKGHHSIQYRTLFGIIVIDSPRLYHCQCGTEDRGSFSLLKAWLTEHVSPELQYIETKWASLMSYGMTADLLKDILPVGHALNASTVKNHLKSVARKMEKELKEKPAVYIGCENDWAALPKPDKPFTVGIDGGYVRNWDKKKTNFEVIAGKSFSENKRSKRFGFVQKFDDNPRHRLMHVLKDQGMQMNQQIEFLSDGAENLRNLQTMMYPEAEHTLDWFHITMRVTILNQFAKGLKNSDPEHGQTIIKDLKSAKWYLWHGNTDKALDKLEDCRCLIEVEELKYDNAKRFIKHLDGMDTYIRNNRYLIPNYGEKYRYDETITTAFVESTINEVIAKRMVKKQQMQWTHQGAHYLLQTRVAVLNGELKEHFKRWYPSFKIEEDNQGMIEALDKAA